LSLSHSRQAAILTSCAEERFLLPNESAGNARGTSFRAKGRGFNRLRLKLERDLESMSLDFLAERAGNNHELDVNAGQEHALKPVSSALPFSTSSNLIIRIGMFNRFEGGCVRYIVDYLWLAVCRWVGWSSRGELRHGLFAGVNPPSDLRAKAAAPEGYDSLSGAPLGVEGLGMSATMLSMVMH
jgi:hypothetical protein